ncbi:hypothetical protein [Amycolatopsis sp. cmx-4-68]|uniref:hypothetical protein n=1 Tax=Amycolatopsis sp. cmx-4-68 TaxID=2790938 RepID=UPI00397C630F
MISARTDSPVEEIRRSRRADLFADAVNSAVSSDEVVRGLSRAPGINAEYLRKRCNLAEEAIWANAFEDAYEFDKIADRRDRLRSRAIRSFATDWLLASPILQRKVTVLGFQFCVVAFFLSGPGVGGAVPQLFLLAAAFLFFLWSLSDEFIARLLRNSTRHRYLALSERLSFEAVIPAVGLTAFLSATISVFPAPSINGHQVPGTNTGWLLPIAAFSLVVGLPFLRYSPRVGPGKGVRAFLSSSGGPLMEHEQGDPQDAAAGPTTPPVSGRSAPRSDGRPTPGPRPRSTGARSTIDEISESKVARLRRSIFRLVVVACGSVLPLIGALVRNSDKSKIVAIARPDTLFVLAGVILVALGVMLSLTGVNMQPSSVVEYDYSRRRRALKSRILNIEILQLLRTEINNNSRSFSVKIKVEEAPGLGEIADPMYKVETAVSREVASLVKSMPGGSIGLAGSRGCGKTTLIESYCGTRRVDLSTLAVMVAAPVEYSAREFLLHLFEKVCKEVIGSNGQIPTGFDPLVRMHRRRSVAMFALGALMLAAVGIFLLVSPALGLLVTTSQLWGFAALLIALSLVLQIARSLGLSGAILDPNGSLADLAKERLEEIRYQQAFSSTWTGSVKAPVGLESAFAGGRSITRQQMNLPEIVDSLRGFLETASSERRVFIGIDELDKIHSERAAEKFLNDIKGIFGVRGCFYMVSVSEEAMVGFERRGMPFRDVFDSTFDEIVWFGPIGVTEAVTAIDRRVVGMPVPFKLLCHALAGGLPRDLIRVARSIIGSQDFVDDPESDQPVITPTDLSRLVMRLVGFDVVRKTRAVAVAAHRIELEPDVSRFLVVSGRALGNVMSPSFIRARIAEIAGTELIRSRKEGASESAASLLRLMQELVTYYYYSATIWEFFDSNAPGSRWHSAMRESEGAVEGLRLLVKARQAFALNSRVAWELVSLFRDSCGLSVDVFPAELEMIEFCVEKLP